MHGKDNKLATGKSLAACTCKFDIIPSIQHNHNNYQEDSKSACGITSFNQSMYWKNA